MLNIVTCCPPRYLNAVDDDDTVSDAEFAPCPCKRGIEEEDEDSVIKQHTSSKTYQKTFTKT